MPHVPAEFTVADHRCYPSERGVVVFMDELKDRLGWSPAVIVGELSGEALEKAVRAQATRGALARLFQSCLFARVSRGPEWERETIPTSYESAVANLSALDRHAAARAMVKARRAGVPLSVLEPLAERYVDRAG